MWLMALLLSEDMSSSTVLTFCCPGSSGGDKGGEGDEGGEGGSKGGSDGEGGSKLVLAVTRTAPVLPL